MTERMDASCSSYEASCVSCLLCDAWRTETRPRVVLFVDDVPKNAMGKVNKKQLAPLFVAAKTK